jgi:hypothetical protein
MKIRPVGAELFHTDQQIDRRAEEQTDRQTGKHNETNNRFSQLFERA